jgi:hypothetical protein
MMTDRPRRTMQVTFHVPPDRDFLCRGQAVGDRQSAPTLERLVWKINSPDSSVPNLVQPLADVVPGVNRGRDTRRTAFLRRAITDSDAWRSGPAGVAVQP